MEVSNDLLNLLGQSAHSELASFFDLVYQDLEQLETSLMSDIRMLDEFSGASKHIFKDMKKDDKDKKQEEQREQVIQQKTDLVIQNALEKAESIMNNINAGRNIPHNLPQKDTMEVLEYYPEGCFPQISKPKTKREKQSDLVKAYGSAAFKPIKKKYVKPSESKYTFRPKRKKSISKNPDKVTSMRNRRGSALGKREQRPTSRTKAKKVVKTLLNKRTTTDSRSRANRRNTTQEQPKPPLKPKQLIRKTEGGLDSKINTSINPNIRDLDRAKIGEECLARNVEELAKATNQEVSLNKNKIPQHESESTMDLESTTVEKEEINEFNKPLKAGKRLFNPLVMETFKNMNSSSKKGQNIDKKKIKKLNILRELNNSINQSFKDYSWNFKDDLKRTSLQKVEFNFIKNMFEHLLIKRRQVSSLEFDTEEERELYLEHDFVENEFDNPVQRNLQTKWKLDLTDSISFQIKLRKFIADQNNQITVLKELDEKGLFDISSSQFISFVEELGNKFGSPIYDVEALYSLWYFCDVFIDNFTQLKNRRTVMNKMTQELLESFGNREIQFLNQFITLDDYQNADMNGEDDNNLKLDKNNLKGDNDSTQICIYESSQNSGHIFNKRIAVTRDESHMKEDVAVDTIQACLSQYLHFKHINTLKSRFEEIKTKKDLKMIKKFMKELRALDSLVERSSRSQIIFGLKRPS